LVNGNGFTGWPTGTSSIWGTNGVSNSLPNGAGAASVRRGSSTIETLSRAADGLSRSNDVDGSSVTNGGHALASWTSPWSQTASLPRPQSGNTSPRSHASVYETYGSTAQLDSTPSNAQRTQARSRPQTSSMEPSYNNTSFADYPHENGTSDSYPQLRADSERFTAFPRNQRPFGQSLLNGAVGTNHSEGTRTSLPHPFGGFAYPPSASHSQRPSLAAISTGYNVSNTNGHAEETSSISDIENTLRNVTIGSGLNGIASNGGSNGVSNGVSNGLSNGLSNGAPTSGFGSFGSSTNGSQAFQFNPISQPWESSQENPLGFGAARPTLPTPAPTPADDVAYFATLASALNGSRTSQQQQTMNLWAPSSSQQDPRVRPDMDRRGFNQPFIQAPQTLMPPSSFYGANFPPYPPAPFDTYSPVRPNFPSMSAVPLLNLYGIGPGAVPFGSRDHDPSRDVRSVLLEEFKSSSKSSKRWELKDIRGHIVEFSGDQDGSRFIQQKLLTANSEEKEWIFREIEPNAVQLMKDLFGNYVIQKFFEHGSMAHKTKLAQAMHGKMFDLSTQTYGCRVVQKALEHVLVEEQAVLVKELQPEILKVIKNQNGNHVVQQIIAVVSRSEIDFIMDSMKGRISELASDAYACRVVQRVLERGTDDDKAFILKELHACAQMLVVDQYGNYVAQHVIQHGKPEDRSKMIEVVIPQVVGLSKHKFASNVVETCIAHGTPEQQRAIRDQILPANDTQNSLLQLMKDPYGNYVIQKLLDTLKGQDRDVLCVKMRPLFDILRKQGHSGRQAAAVDRLWAAINRPQPQPQVQAQAATQNGNSTQSNHPAPSSSEIAS